MHGSRRTGINPLLFNHKGNLCPIGTGFNVSLRIRRLIARRAFIPLDASPDSVLPPPSARARLFRIFARAGTKRRGENKIRGETRAASRIAGGDRNPLDL